MMVLVRCLSQGCQILMYKLKRDGAFTDCGGASFYRVETDVAGDEDAGDAGLEQIGVAVESPGFRRLRLEVGTGEDEALAVATELLRQPTGFGFGADKDEEGTGLPGLFAVRSFEGQAFEVSVAVHGDDLRASLDGDVRRGFDLVDEVL